MALTVTSRGTGTHNTGATTLVPGGRTATLAAGSMGVFCIALDNAGSGGASTCAPSSWTDAKGNVWTRQQSALYDNGAASAGIEMAIYTAPITVALLTSDLGTITWDGGVSPVAKAWTWYEVIPGAGTVSVTGGGTIAGATAANAQVTTASVPVGDAVIAGYFAENVNAVTGDSDTTNGTWTAQQTATVGSTTSGVRIATQQKVQTTTASTQSYDVTVASQDRIAGYVLLHELVATTVTPGVLAMTTALFAPTVTATNNQVVTPGVAALATSVFAPTVAVTDHQSVTPGIAALTLTSFAPTVTVESPGLTVTPGTASLITATFAPTVAASDHKTVVPTTAALATSAFAPTVAVTNHQAVTPTTKALALTAFAPDVVASDHKIVTPAPASLALTTFAPNVGSPIEVTPAARALALTAFAPNVVLTDHKIVTPGTAGLVIDPFAPTVTAGASQTVTPGPLGLTLTGYAPTIVAGGTPLPDDLVGTVTDSRRSASLAGAHGSAVVAAAGRLEASVE
jgi:hypothetical protein